MTRKRQCLLYIIGSQSFSVLSRKYHFLPTFLASALLCSMPAFAQLAPTLPGVMSERPATKAVAQLFDNVAFWTQRGQPNIAVQDLERVIALAPPDADTLALAARLNFQVDRYETADAYRLRLQKLSPNDPRLPALATEKKRMPEELRFLAEARRLTAAGRKEDAIKSYREFFGNKVPDSLAIEFYTILGTTSPEGFKIATDEMPKVAARWPGDASFKLATAQLLTFQESTRYAGISQLAELTKVPIVAAGARLAWHDALLWQGGDINTRDQIDVYLKENPSDPQLEAKRKEIQEGLPDAGLLARMRAYEDDVAGRKDDAEKGFLDALRIHPDDTEAMIMLSIIRRKQLRLRDSDELIAKAFTLTPDRKAEFIETIGFDPETLRTTANTSAQTAGAAQSAAAANRQLAAEYARVRTLVTQGKYTEAEKLLRRLTGRNWNAGSYVTLGYIEKEDGRLPDAEKSFRSAIKADPNNANYLMSLADIEMLLGRRAEMDELFVRARSLYANSRNIKGVDVINRIQSEHLRAQAESTDTPAEGIALYKKALQIDPSNGWLRLDLARALEKQGGLDEARLLMKQVDILQNKGADDVLAAIVFAEQVGDLSEARRLIDNLPTALRTSEIRDTEARIKARERVQSVPRTAGRAAYRANMIELARQPDPNGVWGTQAGWALIKAGDRTAVRDIVLAAISVNPNLTLQQKISYANLLALSQFADDAQALVAGLTNQGLSGKQRSDLKELNNTLAVQHSATLAREGHSAEAVALIQAKVAEQPDNINLGVALSQTYLAAGKNIQAANVAKSVLKHNSENLSVRIASIDVMIATSDLNEASQLIRESLELFPQESLLYIRAGELEVKRGNNRLALSNFRRAKELYLKVGNEPLEIGERQ
jgi:tetratricopeptide (TPR) repeat protein